MSYKLFSDCACMGEYHGVDHAGNDWFSVSDTRDIKWGELEWACRKIELNDQPETTINDLL